MVPRHDDAVALLLVSTGAGDGDAEGVGEAHPPGELSGGQPTGVLRGPRWKSDLGAVVVHVDRARATSSRLPVLVDLWALDSMALVKTGWGFLPLIVLAGLLAGCGGGPVPVSGDPSSGSSAAVPQPDDSPAAEAEASPEGPALLDYRVPAELQELTGYTNVSDALQRLRQHADLLVDVDGEAYAVISGASVFKDFWQELPTNPAETLVENHVSSGEIRRAIKDHKALVERGTQVGMSQIDAAADRAVEEYLKFEDNPYQEDDWIGPWEEFEVTRARLVVLKALAANGALMAALDPGDPPKECPDYSTVNRHSPDDAQAVTELDMWRDGTVTGVIASDEIIHCESNERESSIDVWGDSLPEIAEIADSEAPTIQTLIDLNEYTEPVPPQVRQTLDTMLTYLSAKAEYVREAVAKAD